MNYFSLRLIIVCIISISSVRAQEIDILLKGGHIIDPANGIDTIMDVAVANGKILSVSPDISPLKAKKVINVQGMYVAPGLIDIHTHNFFGTSEDFYMNGPNGLPPDGFTFRNGVTTVVDAGSSGWRNFLLFKKQTIDQSLTRVLVFLNIVGEGMKGKESYEQDINDMDPKLTANSAKKNKEYVVGIKSAHFLGDFTSVDRAVEASKQAGGIPVMVDFGYNNPANSIQYLFMERFKPGDIFTHTFHAKGAGPVNYREAVVDDYGKVKPFVFEAQKRGIIFDVGMGGGGLDFSQLIPSYKQGFLPNTISTDLHKSSMNGSLKSMSNLMSMFLSLGMSIQDVILRTTWNPAIAINRKELGNLSPGSVADIAVLHIKDGEYGFMDVYRKRVNGTKRIETELTFRAGNMVWNLNGLGETMWEERQ